MDMFNCDDVATLLTKRKQKFAGSFARIDTWQYTVRTGSRDIWLAIITTIIFCVVVFVSILFYYLVCFRCLYDEIKINDLILSTLDNQGQRQYHWHCFRPNCVIHATTLEWFVSITHLKLTRMTDVRFGVCFVVFAFYSVWPKRAHSTTLAC